MMKPAIAVLSMLVMAASVTLSQPDFVMSAKADLDGDSEAENITLTPLERAYGCAFTLTVNGASITDKLADRPDGFKIVDIDENDRYKEVAVHTPGPSDDDQYFYFWYNGRELHRTGKLARWPKYLGHGIVLVHGWYGFWEPIRKYVLTAEHKLKLIAQEFHWVGVAGPARKSFPSYSTRDSDRVQATVRAGSKVLVVLCDFGETGMEDEQYLLKTEHGQLGWVQHKTLMLLDGLVWAD